MKCAKEQSIPEEHRGEALVYIDTVEQKQLQSVEAKAMDVSIAKEILKMKDIIN